MEKNEIYLVVTERDTDNPFRSEGAIIHEQYTKAATLEHALERAKALGSKYGRAWIVRGEVMGVVGEFKTGPVDPPNHNSIF